MVDIEERISVLLKQEITSYRTEDYVATGYQQKLPFFRLQNQESLSSTQGEGISNNGIKRLWREKICQWCYEVIDHFDISREIVSIAVNYLDRFLSLQSVDRTGFQLLAMSCLHLAIKLYEPSVVTMKTMIELSRGTFLEEHMVKMEVALLRYVTNRMMVCMRFSLEKERIEERTRDSDPSPPVVSTCISRGWLRCSTY